MAQRPKLELLSETRFDHRVPASFPASCPTVNLAASWNAATADLLIVRPVSQVVSRIRQSGKRGEKAPEPLAVSWKPDGQLLAVGWSDGSVRLVGVESSKVAHHLRVGNDAAAAKITCIAWTSSHVGKPRGAAKSKSASATSWKDVLGEDLDIDSGTGVLDLPKELTFLEVDTALPKMSPLPSGTEGEDSMVFTARAVNDVLFKPLKSEESDRIHVMMVGLSNGQLHLSIYNSFVVGVFDFSSVGSPPHDGTFQLVQHASHPDVSTHSLFVRVTDKTQDVVTLVPMDLPFISSSPINLTLLASKLTTLQTLLRYLRQTYIHMLAEWKNTQELPNRFLRSIQEDLAKAESGPQNIVEALFHTLATGHTHETVKEWLTESLAERGHKRWDKAVTSGLEALRNLTHENFLPALTRANIILSRLRGLAKFHSAREDTGFSVPQLTQAMDTVACLSLVSNKILLQTMEQLELFSAFSPWLRFTIDRLAAGMSSTTADEMIDAESRMDNERILDYITLHLVDNPLGAYFDEEVPKEEFEKGWQAAKNGANLMDLLDTQMQKREQGKDHLRALPLVDFLLQFLSTSAEGVFGDIAEAQRRSVRLGPKTRISIGGPVGRLDARMAAEFHEDGTDGLTFTTLTPKDKTNELYIFRTQIRIINGISSEASTTVCALDLGDGKLTDVKFLDDSTLVIIWTPKDQRPSLVQLPIQSPHMPYQQYIEDSLPAPRRLEDELPLAQQVAIYDLPDEPSPHTASTAPTPPFTPIQLDVHATTDVRGPLPARFGLLGANKMTYRVCVLPGSLPKSSPSDATGSPPSSKEADPQKGSSHSDAAAETGTQARRAGTEGVH